MRTIFALLRNQLVTGFIFIMPVLIVLAVIGRFWRQLLRVGTGFCKLLGVDTVFGPAGDAVAAVLFFLFICFLAGFLVRISFLRKVSELIDLQLGRGIPGYNDVRQRTAKKIGAGSNEPLFEGCLVKVQEHWRPGYIIETNADGTQIVYVPQAPALTSGQVYVVEPGQVRKLDVDSAVLNAYPKLGWGS
jgi:uncharacterized membrane protein